MGSGFDPMRTTSPPAAGPSVSAAESSALMAEAPDVSLKASVVRHLNAAHENPGPVENPGSPRPGVILLSARGGAIALIGKSTTDAGRGGLQRAVWESRKTGKRPAQNAVRLRACNDSHSAGVLQFRRHSASVARSGQGRMAPSARHRSANIRAAGRHRAKRSTARP
jgi:hypothetical protein